MVVRIGEPVNGDWIRWAGYHDLEVIRLQGANFLKLNQPCRHLKNNICAIHANKPELCKKFYCEDPAYQAFKSLL